MTPEEELIYLESHKAYINTRISKLRQKIKNDKRPKVGHRLSYSGLWVQSDCLIPYINDHWIRFGHSINSLEDKAGISHGNISKILSGGRQWTREEMADSILMALGLPHVFGDIPKVRIKRTYGEVQEPPYSHYEEP